MDPILNVLALIQVSPRTWTVLGNGLICSGPDCDCPLVAMAKDHREKPGWLYKWTNVVWQTAGGTLGLVKSESDAIAFAADDDVTINQWLRLALLACCGIKPIGDAT